MLYNSLGSVHLICWTPIKCPSSRWWYSYFMLLCFCSTLWKLRKIKWKTVLQCRKRLSDFDYVLPCILFQIRGRFLVNLLLFCIRNGSVIIINLVTNEILFVFGSGYNYVLFSPISTRNREEVFFYIQSGQKNVETRGVLVTHSCSALCNHMVCNPPSSMGFCRQEY